MSWILLPVAAGFAAVVALRRHAYLAGWLHAERLPVPVVVVGNVTVGGSGKTPLVIHLAQAMLSAGWKPGIVSRGYRGTSEGMAVAADSDPVQAGDEAVLLAARSGCPVFVGADRPAAARALLANHPGCDIILADDGLQHYRLARQIELAVLDERGLQNGLPLPAGPLREPASRLGTVDALVLNGIAVPPAPTFDRPLFHMRLEGTRLYPANAGGTAIATSALAGKRLHAVAGIGSPQRFFGQLRRLGLEFVEHEFPDHYAYRAADLDFLGDAILTTEKDAVKLAGLALSIPVFVLPVHAVVEPDIAAFVMEKLDGFAPA